MPRKKSRRQRHEGDESFLLLTLLKGPGTREEIVGTYHRFGALLGIPTPAPGTRKHSQWQREVDDGLSHLLERGLIVRNEQGAYCLTEQGAEEASELDHGLQKVTRPLRTFLSSGETAAKASVVANLLLSVLKLGTGFLFNCMALIADGFDSLIDVVSAIVVFLGIKYRRELPSTAFIILVMFGTAIWVGYESVTRLIHPEAIDAGVLTIVVAVVSGSACYLMSAYQYMVGRRLGSLSLISQSVDSRNHVFVAVAVLIGIVFARFGIFIVDSVVGLGVAIMMLKSAIELTAETLRLARGGELDLSRFVRPEEKAFEKHRRNYFKSWMLLSLREVDSKAEIVSRCQRAFSTESLPIVDHFSFVKAFDFEKHIDSLLEELVDEGLAINKAANYHLTGRGRKELRKKLGYQRFM